MSRTATVTPAREREIVGLRSDLADAERDLEAATETRNERLADVKRRGGVSAVHDVDVHRLLVLESSNLGAEPPPPGPSWLAGEALRGRLRTRADTPVTLGD